MSDMTMHLSNRVEIYTLSDLIRHYQDGGGSRHWFDPDTLKFFKSKVNESLFYDRERILFVSSEQGPDGVRRYSVREYNPTSRDIQTVGLGFQGYKTLAAAKLAALKMVSV